MYTIPENFSRQMIEMYDDAGVAWLEQLPDLIDDCARRWSLRVLAPYTLSFNYVAPAIRADGAPVVFKAGMHQDTKTEIDALRHFAGHGMVRMLEADRERGAFVLERLAPGVSLVSMEDDERATAIAAEVMLELWRGPAGTPPARPTIPNKAVLIAGMRRMREHFGGSTGPLPRALVEQAEALFADLLASQAAPVLLHGDLHHDNILSAERAPWLAIDPKGVIGEPAYEVGAWLRNWLPDLLERPDPARTMARRVDQLAEALGVDRARIRGWGLAQAVLSVWWCIEDGGSDWEPTIACAELLAQIR
jgi:streptomycin 6-kinase